MTPQPRPLVLLGATGSIGQSTLDLLPRFSQRFRVVAASAYRRGEELAEIIRAHQVKHFALAEESAREAFSQAHPDLREGLAAAGGEGILELLAEAPKDALVVNGVVGAAGLQPTVEALRRGLDVALANKEALVVGGELVLEAARTGKATLWPVDSEHSAIAQCLRAAGPSELRRIWLTASGGPFRDTRPEDLAHVSLEQVLDHPNWDMGPKITVDSATMMNKGLEVIEAKLLFRLHLDDVQVVLHRQSIVHSMIELRDGAFLAQLGTPDMRLPILYALSGGEHWATDFPALDPLSMGSLDFEAPDPRRYPCLGLARAAAESGGSAPLVLNAANEEAVAGLLRGELSFVEIAPLIERALQSLSGPAAGSVPEALQKDTATRRLVRSWITS
jgi:1-deoxy-D-xylulose-5-phosphate reductoisomerase